MADEPRRGGSGGSGAAGEADDIEITEIQGLPADAPPPSGVDGGEEPDAGEERGGTASGNASGGEEPATERLERELQQAREDLLRVRADFENFRKRQARERAEFARHAAAELVERMLPVLDNFKRALAMEPAGDAGEAAYREGVRLIYRQLSETLADAGLTPIETEGQIFDPNLHEAVAREETDRVEPNTITAELEPGYRFRERLLKPARVRVAVPPPES